MRVSLHGHDIQIELSVIKLYTRRTQYGPVFRLLLGGHRVTVVGSPEAIHNVLVSDSRAFTTRAQNYEHLRVVGSDPSLYQKLHETAVREIFPILDKHFSKRNLGDLTPGFAEIVYNTVKRFNGNDLVSLKRSVTEPLYIATNGCASISPSIWRMQLLPMAMIN